MLHARQHIHDYLRPIDARQHIKAVLGISEMLSAPGLTYHSLTY